MRTEHALQVAVVKYLRGRGLTVLHVPNEGKRGIREAARLQREGVVAGVPDILVMDWPPFWIELKAPKGRLSAAQIAFGAAAVDLGWGWYVCRSLADVEAVVGAWWVQARQGMPPSPKRDREMLRARINASLPERPRYNISSDDPSS